MAATILSSLKRVPLFRPAVLGCCGLRNRPPFTPMTEDEDEDDLDSEKDEEQEVLKALRRHNEAIRFRRIKREMEPSGPPERRLTWNAMEQIRYLNQDFPEEWTLQRLAVGFNVSTDVIRRVLKSQFVPSAARKMKQDSAVSRNIGQLSSKTKQDQLTLMPSSKHPTQQLLTNGNSDGKLLVSHSPPLLPSPKTDFSRIAVRTKDTQTHLAHPSTSVPENMLQKVRDVSPSPALTSGSPNRQEETVPVEEDWQTLDEKWDGVVLSEQDLEELATSGLELKMKVVQKGKEFFDGDGSFLYRI